MAKRNTNGGGATPLPTPQARARFMAALTAPLPKAEAINPRVEADEAKDDERRVWVAALMRCDAAHHLRKYHEARHQITLNAEQRHTTRKEDAELTALRQAERDAIDVLMRIPATRRDQVTTKRKAAGGWLDNHPDWIACIARDCIALRMKEVRHA